jgi:putative transposase
MTTDRYRHHRRSIRLRDYDYTQAGAYFVTIVCQDRACLFGNVIDGAMHLNDAGKMVQAVWDEIPLYYPGVDIDANPAKWDIDPENPVVINRNHR